MPTYSCTVYMYQRLQIYVFSLPVNRLLFVWWQFIAHSKKSNIGICWTFIVSVSSLHGRQCPCQGWSFNILSLNITYLESVLF